MRSTKVNVTGGADCVGLLLVAFIILKLCSVINWSWWWVLSPLWIPLAIVAAIAVLFCAVWCVVKTICVLYKKAKTQQ